MILKLRWGDVDLPDLPSKIMLDRRSVSRARSLKDNETAAADRSSEVFAAPRRLMFARTPCLRGGMQRGRTGAQKGEHQHRSTATAFV
jgi:hypothetical protein